MINEDIYKWLIFGALFGAAMICLSLLMSGCAPIPEDQAHTDPEAQVLDEGEWISQDAFLQALADDYKLVRIGGVQSGINQGAVYLLIYDANPGGTYYEKAIIVITGDGVAISGSLK